MSTLLLFLTLFSHKGDVTDHWWYPPDLVAVVRVDAFGGIRHGVLASQGGLSVVLFNTVYEVVRLP